MCGIIGIFKQDGDVNVELYEGLLMLQHRCAAFHDTPMLVALGSSELPVMCGHAGVCASGRAVKEAVSMISSHATCSSWRGSSKQSP